MSFLGNPYLLSEIISIWKEGRVFLSMSGENASKQNKNIEYLYMQFEVQMVFQQYLSSFLYLKKKDISDNSEFISEIATYSHIMVV